MIKMISLSYRLLILFGVILSMVGCNKDFVEPGLSGSKERGDSIRIRYSFDIDANDLRFFQSADASGLPKSLLDQQQHFRVFFLITLRDGKKQLLSGDLTGYKVKGKNIYSCKGENWYKLDETYDYATETYITYKKEDIVSISVYLRVNGKALLQPIEADAQNKISVGVPYESDVVSVDLSDIKPSTERPDPNYWDINFHHTVTLKPMGNLLRLNVYNDTENAVAVKGINIWGNAFAFGDIASVPGNDPRFVNGFSNRGVLDHYAKTLPLPAVKTFAPGEQRTYYLWVIPRVNDYNSMLIRAVGPNGEVYHPFYSEEPLREGTTKINLSLKAQKELTVAEAFPSGHLPLEHMALYNLKSPTEMATDDDVYNVFHDNSASSVNVAGYYVPSSLQWEAIFLPSIPFDGGGPNYRLVQQVQLPGQDKPQTVLAFLHFNRGVANVIHLGGKANRRLIAYRYKVTNQLGHFLLEVRSRYLGPKFLGDIKTIADEAYWNTPDGTEVVRTMKLNLGYYLSDKKFYGMSTDSRSALRYRNSNSNYIGGSIRLFKERP